jgi:hypothetical protein
MRRHNKNNGRNLRGKGGPASQATALKAREVNLEMEGDHLKVYSLQTLLTNKKNPETRAMARLADVLLPWFEKTIHQPAEKLGGVLELWQELAPVELQKRSRLLGLARGVLTVAADSATVRSELDARLRAGLLRAVQTASKGAVFKVKTCVQPMIPEVS